MSAPVLLSEDSGGVRVLTLNRPDKRNALDSALTFALVEAFESAEADETVRAIILTGAGPAFSAGADMREFQVEADGNKVLSAERSAAYRKLLAMIPTRRMPVIAAINGFALGGGCALAIACDMVLAVDIASFGYPEIKHGFTARGIVPPLVRQVGRKAAFELIMTGRAVTPDEALRMGMINRIVAADALMEEARALGATFAGYALEALAMMKKILYAVADVPVADGIAYVDGQRD